MLLGCRLVTDHHPDQGPVPAEPEGTAEDDTAVLTAALLSEESARRDAQARASEQVLFADDLLPGVGDEEMPLRKGLAMGGAFTFIVLLVLNSLDELEQAAMAVLAPDIRDTFGVSDGTITFIASASAAFVVLGAFPMGWLADRVRRAPIVGVASAVFSAMVFLSGFAVNAFMLFFTRFGAGIAKSNTIPVHSSLLADTYPIGVRGRIGGLTQSTGRAVAAISPIAVGTVAWIAGGDEGWRWAFFLLGLPVAVFAVAAFRIPEPTRGQWEKTTVLSQVITDPDPAPISVEAAFARLLRIQTVRAVLFAFVALGFVLFTIPVQSNLFLEDEFGLGTFGRGVATSVAGFAAAVVLPMVGLRFDRLYRRDPSLTLRLIGGLLLPTAFLVPLQFAMPNEYLFVVVDVPRTVLSSAAFAMVAPVVWSIVPYRLRGLGSALITLFIFLFGAVGGSLVAAFLVDSYGVQTAVTVLALPAVSIGSIFLIRGSRSIKHDLSMVVAELKEEMAEHDRRRIDPESTPALQASNIDFSYGAVQVLFDVSFEVAQGKTLALLGANGAGKSTALSVVTGLFTPERGEIRMHGRSITYTTPEQRSAMGVQMLPGGRGVFRELSIEDNLRIGAYKFRRDPADVQRRIDRVVEMFEQLEGRLGERAGDLSGGQQQMLALARVMMHDPEILIIDEMSLGLAPTIVQDLVAGLQRLREAGQTMIVVEQSLNLALSLADDTVFLEKGEVRHSGPARDVIERPELMHAVLFGAGADPVPGSVGDARADSTGSVDSSGADSTGLPSDSGNGS
ncbi:MAG: MFS transporter [Acidimicrobiia bacterium]|nr:MFS transporter [Acidimicrobiia bacterium]